MEISNQPDQPDQPDQPGQLIDFKELFLILWDSKYWIGLSVSIFAVGSVIYALSLPNLYYSESLLKLSTQTRGNDP